MIFELLAGEVLKKWKKQNEFSLGRCRRMHFWRSHGAWGSQTKRFPFSMGKPKPRIATPLERERPVAQITRLLLLWICGDLESANWQPRGEFKGKLENDQKYLIFWKSSKWKMLLKPLVGAIFRSEEVTTTKVSICDPSFFLGRGWDFCQNLYRTRTRVGDAGTGGSTTIFF